VRLLDDVNIEAGIFNDVDSHQADQDPVDESINTHTSIDLCIELQPRDIIHIDKDTNLFIIIDLFLVTNSYVNQSS
jgi:hypothetical protein